MEQSTTEDAFTQEVRRLRSLYQKRRDLTNLTPPVGRPVFDVTIDEVDGIVYHTYFYERDDSSLENSMRCQVIRIVELSGTLSSAILRLERNLPELSPNCDYEIVGDVIRQL
jgi:hypothetical protein